MQTSAIIRNIDQILAEKVLCDIIGCEDITPRQCWIMFRTSQGYDDEWIADECKISPLTVKKDRDNGFRRAGIHSKPQLMAWMLMQLFRPKGIILPEAPSQPVKRYELLNI